MVLSYVHYERSKKVVYDLECGPRVRGVVRRGVWIRVRGVVPGTGRR